MIRTWMKRIQHLRESPMIYVALLRGINVGKAKRIAMADLKRVMEGLGFVDVRTLLNSGNVVFSSKMGDALTLAQMIEKAVEEAFEIQSRVVVCSAGTLKTIVSECPFKAAEHNPSAFLVAFVTDANLLSKFSEFGGRSWEPEDLQVGSQSAYFWCSESSIKSKLLAAVQKLLKDELTTRNWSTVVKLTALVETS